MSIRRWAWEHEWPTRSFKSGNSVAVRIPVALGVKAGQEWTITERDGDLVLRLAEKPKRKSNIDKVWGSATNLKPIDEDDRWFEERLPDESGQGRAVE